MYIYIYSTSDRDTMSFRILNIKEDEKFSKCNEYKCKENERNN